MPSPTELSVRVETVANIFRRAPEPEAVRTFGQVLALRRQGCDFNRLPVYAFDFVGLHHLISISAEGKEPRLAAGASGVLLSECDAVAMSFPALEGMREVPSKSLLSAVSQMVSEHRTTKVPLGYAGGYTILEPFRHHREALGPLLEVLAALVADDFYSLRLGRLVTFGFLGRSARLITRLGFSVVPDADTGKRAFPAPYLPGSFASFFEMTEPSQWARDCRERWAPVLRERDRVLSPQLSTNGSDPERSTSLSA
jgi:hypothetical protein